MAEVKRRRIWAPAMCGLALAACGPDSDPRGGHDRVTAIFANGFKGEIVGRSGKRIGTIAGRKGEDGLIVAFEVSGLSPGRHGIHLHAGRCEPPDFASAGGHWNASNRQHGTDNPQGPHDGDWDNLDVDAAGRGSTERMIPRWHSRIPDSGLALVIHARADDGVSQPEGRSGERVACAVVIPPV